MIPLSMINRAFVEKGYAVYANEDPKNLDLSVKKGMAIRLFNDTSYLALPSVGNGRNVGKIQAFIRNNDIAQPTLRMPVRKIIEHDFGDDQGDCSLLNPGDMVTLNGFRPEDRKITVILEEGRIRLTRQEFLGAIWSLPELPGLAAIVAGFDASISKKSIKKVRSNLELAAWIAAKKGLHWNGKDGKLHANYYEGGGRYWLEMRYNLTQCGNVNYYDLSVSRWRQEMPFFSDKLRPLAFFELWNKVTPSKLQFAVELLA